MTNPIRGKSHYLIGTRNRLRRMSKVTFRALIISSGGSLADTVSDADLVVLGVGDGLTKKGNEKTALKQARKAEIAVVSEDEFLTSIGLGGVR